MSGLRKNSGWKKKQCLARTYNFKGWLNGFDISLAVHIFCAPFIKHFPSINSFFHCWFYILITSFGSKLLKRCISTEVIWGQQLFFTTVSPWDLMYFHSKTWDNQTKTDFKGKIVGQNVLAFSKKKKTTTKKTKNKAASQKLD